MSYSSNPLLLKARADAVRLLVIEQLPVADTTLIAYGNLPVMI
jgi:hypothetical protein